MGVFWWIDLDRCHHQVGLARPLRCSLEAKHPVVDGLLHQHRAVTLIVMQHPPRQIAALPGQPIGSAPDVAGGECAENRLSLRCRACRRTWGRDRQLSAVHMLEQPGKRS